MSLSPQKKKNNDDSALERSTPALYDDASLSTTQAALLKWYDHNKETSWRDINRHGPLESLRSCYSNSSGLRADYFDRFMSRFPTRFHWQRLTGKISRRSGRLRLLQSREEFVGGRKASRGATRRRGPE